MNINKATVLITSGCDIVSLKTDKPCPFVPEFLPSQPPLALKFEATKGTGIEYVRQYFGLDPEVIDVS